MKLYEILRRTYQYVCETVPTTLAANIPSSWLDKHPALNRERTAKTDLEIQTENLKVQLTRANTQYEGALERITAVQNQNEWLQRNLDEASNYASERDRRIMELERDIEEINRQLTSARHWKRDAVVAGHKLLPALADLEAIQQKRKMVIAADHRDRIVYASQGALKILGYTRESLYETNVYRLLGGTDQKLPGQIKFTMHTEITQDSQEKIFLPKSKLIRGKGKPIDANLTIIPVYAGTIYLGSIIRGESSEEKRTRMAKEREKRTAEEKALSTVTDAVLAKSRGIVAAQLASLSAIFKRRENPN